MTKTLIQTISILMILIPLRESLVLKYARFYTYRQNGKKIIHDRKTDSEYIESKNGVITKLWNMKSF